MAKKAKKRPVTKAKRKTQVILPMKLSALVKIALRDIRKAERVPKKFVIDMSDWYRPETVECRTNENVLIETHDVCSLCAAGSVMAFSLGALKNHPNDYLEPCDFPRNQSQLNAINQLREGQVTEALSNLVLNINGDKFDVLYSKACDLDTTIPSYDRNDPEPFHKAMTSLQGKLAKAGL